MADEVAATQNTKTDDKAPIATPPAPSPETQTANDQTLAINKMAPLNDVPVADEAPAKAVDAPNFGVPADTAEKSPISEPTPAAEVKKDDTAVMISEADVEKVTETPPAEKPSQEAANSQIEMLTGEIQALEAKLEKLTGGISSTSTETPVKPEPLKTEEKIVEKPAEPIKLENTAEKKPDTSAKAPVDDIYSKVLERSMKESQPLPDDADDISVDSEEHESSALGTIGEVMVMFGLVVLLALLALPLYKTALSNDLSEAFRLIGWPTSTISLFIGFILLLFTKGKVVMKIATFIFFLLAAVMLLGAFNYTQFLGPLTDPLQSVFTFYKE